MYKLENLLRSISFNWVALDLTIQGKDKDPFAGRLLNLRAFDKRDKIAAYSKQDCICPICKQHFEFEEMEGDHIKPWSKGGHTTPDNCQMLCRNCNGKKTNK